jgi:hypothetical protein
MNELGILSAIRVDSSGRFSVKRVLPVWPSTMAPCAARRPGSIISMFYATGDHDEHDPVGQAAGPHGANLSVTWSEFDRFRNLAE